MIKKEDVYQIGRIGRPHGVKGEMNFMFTDDVFDRVDSDYLILEVEGILVPFFIEEYRFRTDTTALLKLCDIDTQEQARQYTNCDVYFERNQVADEEEALSYSFLIGFTIVDAATKQPVGKLTAIDDSTENTLFEIVTPDGHDVLLPATDDLTTDIDTTARTITMVIPEGILEL